MSGKIGQLPYVTIGTQKWLRYNLDVNTYRNGDIIPQITETTAWRTTTQGAWCWYNNNPESGKIYGKLYNWYAVNDPRGLAPIGWNIPSVAEYTTLINYLGGVPQAGPKLKSTSGWNLNGTNESGFNALRGGFRTSDSTFIRDDVNNYLWTRDTGYTPGQTAYGLQITNFPGFAGYYSLRMGAYVRCIKN